MKRYIPVFILITLLTGALPNISTREGSLSTDIHHAYAQGKSEKKEEVAQRKAEQKQREAEERAAREAEAVEREQGIYDEIRADEEREEESEEEDTPREESEDEVGTSTEAEDETAAALPEEPGRAERSEIEEESSNSFSESLASIFKPSQAYGEEGLPKAVASLLTLLSIASALGGLILLSGIADRRVEPLLHRKHN